MANTSLQGKSGIQGVPPERLPRHVAIILDGNNRWAKRKHLPGLAGHRAGVNRVREVVEACDEQGVEVLTLFAFSSENWSRPVIEVNGLMRLFLGVLKREARRMQKKRIRLKVIGDITRFSPEIQKYIQEVETLTANDYSVTLVIAANYGGRWDIASAARLLAEKVARGELDAKNIDEFAIEQHLSTSGLPAPDLLIRTSGEQRISNFLLWQCAYSEFYFTDTLWPDFGRNELQQALLSYARRQRRFGKTSEQVEAETLC
ncbi:MULTISPECIES: polyprenyl diphosphate synthase [Gammaproteobacteria]|uniref:polyprenyl diphosphate synthase n=1 Tax=Gammaproteobacteria TaxID=1236 RepID=UPI001ADCB14F|nr:MULTISPECIES: polyprenyl diphosphate synthase [Gammaproteobacteria]MBO9480215.1 di-trans,poly-cis-decaprenylcistransferase [Salinisphaera sp. G21_0]MBO9493462.1 di-trans,poly-cis-decaprenylcistransferase [Thalassotalea sp. G20_0]